MLRKTQLEKQIYYWRHKQSRRLYMFYSFNYITFQLNKTINLA